VIARLPVTMALSDLVESVTRFPVGRGRKPRDAAPPYYLLYSITATYTGAPFSDLNEDTSLIYQLTPVSGPDPAIPDSYGIADQSELLADKVREAILGRNPVTGLWLHELIVPGAKVIGRSLDVEAGGTSDPTDAIMSYALRVRLDLTTA
jgi:hypothetical protein